MLYTRFNHTIVYFEVKLIFSMHNTSKLIFGRQTDFGYMKKLIYVLFSNNPICYELLGKIVQNHNVDKIGLPHIPDPGLVCLWP